MPARLREEGDLLVLKLGGDADEFQHQKAAAKTIAGYRYDPDLKAWCYRNTDDTLVELSQRVEPEMTKPLEARVQAAAAEMAEQLVTTLPDDASVSVPWQDRLAPKQRAGIDFMAEHPHAILADEMGAGKTAEAISTVYEYLLRFEERTKTEEELEIDPTMPKPRVLVICLNAATGHWQREIKKWCGDESTVITGGPDKREKELAESAQWTIINWEKLALMAPELSKIEWDGVIADEAHFAKNPKSKRTKALWKCKAPVQLAVTGTPVMNNPGELFPLLKWLRPEQYTSYWAFFYKFTEYYEGARSRKIVTGVKNADALRFELADKLVRRTKREIHPKIPEPFDPIVYEPEMKAEQAKLYQDALKDFWLEVAQEFAADPPDGVQDYGEARDELLEAVEKGDLNVLKLMIPNAAARTVRLRQIATSPALLGGPDSSGKLDEIERIVRDGGAGRPWVWFAWFRETVDLLVSRFQNMGIEAHGFKGGEGERPDELAQSFQAGEFPIICATIKSGGQSIELQTAADCGFAEEEYVPGINQQAFDRIDRMGQKQRPQRHIVRTPRTVETGKIAPAQGTKKLIVTTILGGS